MKSILLALCLASTGDTYYRNQAGEEDKRQPQVDG